MDKAALVAEVERFSKLGALKVHQKNLQKALEAYRHAFQSVMLLGHNGYMQRACAFNLGAIYISTGSYTDGLTYLKQAEPPNGHHDGSSNGELYFNYGLAYEGLRDTAEMKHYYSKALKEYQSEKSNVKMEAEVISRLGKVYLSSGQYYEAESYVRQLIQVYGKLEDFTKQLQTQVEQASLLIRVDKIEEAEKIADYCFMRVQDQELTSKTANIFIELSLVYTQLCKYDKALQCCQSALQIVNTWDADLKQIAVLYQNLGAIYNYQGQYQDAIEYHQAAASKYAESKNRKSQGHCFMNLGYAYSQLKDIDRTGEYYLHSLQAAKDCGDRRSEWQSLEALGSVCCHQADLQRSMDYYKSALSVLAKSQDADDTVASDRILEKITKLIKLEVHKPDHPVNMTKQGEINHRSPSPNRTHKNLLKKAISKDGSIIAVRKNGKVKYLRVRRSGTLQKFNKVALGLDTNMSPILAQSSRKQGSLGFHSEAEEDEVFSASTVYFSDSEEEKDDDNEAERDVNQSRQSQRVSELDEEIDREVKTDSEDDEKNQVFKAMREVVEHEDDGMASLETEEATAGRHNPLQARFNQDDEQVEDDTEDDDSSIQSTEDKEEDRYTGRVKNINSRHQVPPHIPTMSPKPSYVGPIRTYEVPVKRDNLASTDADGKNFFYSPESPPLLRNKVLYKDSDDETVEKSRLEESGVDGPIYESIPLSSLQDNTDPIVDDATKHLSESGDKDVAHDQLPKGKRDIIEYKAFQASRRAKRENEKGMNNAAGKKSSRMCCMM